MSTHERARRSVLAKPPRDGGAAPTLPFVVLAIAVAAIPVVGVSCSDDTTPAAQTPQPDPQADAAVDAEGASGGGRVEGGGELDAAVCDADLEGDPSHCGACGSPCAPGQICSGGACECVDFAAVSFAADIQPIFTASCTKGMCHVNGAGVLGLELGLGKAYGSLVNVPSAECKDGRKRVLPGQPSQSYLIDKLMGVELCSGKRMAEGMPAAKLQAIVDWICAGAPNN